MMDKPLYPDFSRTTSPITRLRRLEFGSQRLQRGQLRPVQGPYTRLPSDILITKNGKQTIDLRKTAIQKIGGVSPSANTSGFSATATGTTLNIYYDGTNGSQVLFIRRADGTKQKVPTAGSPLIITGLTPSTDYYFLPRWNTENQCNIGWVPGTVGTPTVAFLLADTVDPVNTPKYLIAQTAQGSEPLTVGFMSFSTTSGAGGGPTPGGGGGAPGSCVMSGTDIVTVGEHRFELEILQNWEWVHLRLEDSRELYCTYDHPLYHALRGKVRADELVQEDMVITDSGEQRLVTAEFKKRACSKWKVKMDKGHLFWANGFLSHNWKLRTL